MSPLCDGLICIKEAEIQMHKYGFVTMDFCVDPRSVAGTASHRGLCHCVM